MTLLWDREDQPETEETSVSSATQLAGRRQQFYAHKWPLPCGSSSESSSSQVCTKDQVAIHTLELDKFGDIAVIYNECNEILWERETDPQAKDVTDEAELEAGRYYFEALVIDDECSSSAVSTSSSSQVREPCIVGGQECNFVVWKFYLNKFGRLVKIKDHCDTIRWHREDQANSKAGVKASPIFLLAPQLECNSSSSDSFHSSSSIYCDTAGCEPFSQPMFLLVKLEVHWSKYGRIVKIFDQGLINCTCGGCSGFVSGAMCVEISAIDDGGNRCCGLYTSLEVYDFDLCEDVVQTQLPNACWGFLSAALICDGLEFKLLLEGPQTGILILDSTSPYRVKMCKPPDYKIDMCWRVAASEGESPDTCCPADVVAFCICLSDEGSSCEEIFDCSSSSSSVSAASPDEPSAPL